MNDTIKELKSNNDIQKIDDSLIFDPYNPNNKEITLNEVQSILNNYGISQQINNLQLYKRAFVHRSYTKRPNLENENANIVIVPQPDNCLKLKTKSNERLEFIGDGVLELITKYYLYRRYPKADEGFMTEKKIALVKNEHIGKLAYQMNLHNWIIISRHAEEKKTRTNLKKLGCLFEAFIGALFLDFNKVIINDEDKWFQNVFVTGPGFQIAQKFVENIFERHVDFVELINTDDNYKNILQVIIQKELKITPDYVELEYYTESGYNMGVYICIGNTIHNMDINNAKDISEFDGIESIKNITEKVIIYLGSHTHKIKKKAEQLACKNILEKIHK